MCSILLLICAIFFPPIAVLIAQVCENAVQSKHELCQFSMLKGCGIDLLINILLCLLGFVSDFKEVIRRQSY